MNHIERVKRTIEFQKPDILPYELLDVPGVYDAYATMDPLKLRPIPETDDCDSIRATYYWTFKPEGRNAAGEVMRRDEWGCLHRVPNDMNVAYEIVEKPLNDPHAFNSYKFPKPTVSDHFFETMIDYLKPYRDRFICAYIDPGPFLIAFNLMGYDGLLLRLKDNLQQVVEVIASIVEFQKGIIDRWKSIGVHMIASIDEFAGNTGMMFSPDLWREHFKKYYYELFSHAKNNSMYTSLYLDGDISAIFNDLSELPLDVLESLQPNATGIQKWALKFSGKICLKASADMMSTLPGNDENAVDEELEKLFNHYATERGGFIPVVVRWHRPSFPDLTVRASVKAIQRYRREWTLKKND
jgi:hypothetical protein